MGNVLRRVYTHPLWSSVTFWETAFLVGIFEAQAASVATRRLGPGTRSDEVAMSPFLQRFVNHMTSMGIKHEQAIGSVQKSLRKNEALLGQALAEGYAERIVRFAVRPAAAVPATPADPPLPCLGIQNVGGASLTSTAMEANVHGEV